MNFYLSQHCYGKASKMLFEGNVLVMDKGYLFEGETPTSQLWVGLEETKDSLVVMQLEDGMRAKKQKSEFLGVLNLSHIKEQDQEVLNKMKHRISQDEYRFWNSKRFPTERLSRYRIVTQLREMILSIHLTEKFSLEYSVWLHKLGDKSYQMLSNWGGDYEKAKLDFSIECGFVSEQDLPKGG